MVMKFSDHGCFIRIATQDFIVRYVKIDSNNEAQIKEFFLNFFLLHGKNVDEITKSLLNKLQQNGLDIMMCIEAQHTTMLPPWQESVLKYNAE